VEDISLLLTDYQNQKFRDHFSEKYMPDWHCPHCQKGWLRFGTPFDGSKAHTQETKASEDDREVFGFHPCAIDMNFSAMLSCDRCQRVTYCLGKTVLDPIYDAEPYEAEWEALYFPHVFLPAIPLCNIPLACPDDVKKVIQASFRLAWLDLSAAGNKLRVAIEMLLAYIDPALKPDFTKNRTLGQCINDFCKINPTLGDHLKAIKWLGNDASHDDVLKECDIAVGYQILETVLKELYPTKLINIAAMSTLINSVKGSPAKDPAYQQ